MTDAQLGEFNLEYNGYIRLYLHWFGKHIQQARHHKAIADSHACLEQGGEGKN